MRFHLCEAQRQHGSERLFSRGAEREKVGLEMADRLVAVPPPDEHERRAIPSRLGGVVGERRDRVGLAVVRAERGGTPVHLLIAAQGGVFRHFGWTDSFNTFERMKAILAGRSARRRMRYGYQCVPNGTYTRML